MYEDYVTADDILNGFVIERGDNQVTKDESQCKLNASVVHVEFEFSSFDIPNQFVHYADNKEIIISQNMMKMHAERIWKYQ